MTFESNKTLKDNCSLFYKNMNNELKLVTCTNSQAEFTQLATGITKDIRKTTVVSAIGVFSILGLVVQLAIIVLLFFAGVISKRYLNYDLIQNNAELFISYSLIGAIVCLITFSICLAIPVNFSNGICTPLLIWALQDMGYKEASFESGIIVKNTRGLDKNWPASVDISKFINADFSKLEITNSLQLLNDMCSNYILSDGHAILLVNQNNFENNNNQPNITLEQIKNVGLEKTSVRAEEMIRAYGVSKTISVLAIKYISVDEFGTLYRINSTDEGAWSLAFVCVEDSGVKTDEYGLKINVKTHWLTVPPYMISAREAVAWTFGKKAQDYQPIVEV